MPKPGFDKSEDNTDALSAWLPEKTESSPMFDLDRSRMPERFVLPTPALPWLWRLRTRVAMWIAPWLTYE